MFLPPENFLPALNIWMENYGNSARCPSPAHPTPSTRVPDMKVPSTAHYHRVKVPLACEHNVDRTRESQCLCDRVTRVTRTQEGQRALGPMRLSLLSSSSSFSIVTFFPASPPKAEGIMRFLYVYLHKKARNCWSLTIRLSFKPDLARRLS